MSDTPHVILEIIGGSEDGRRYESPIANGYYWQADHGRVGSRFRVIPDAYLSREAFQAGFSLERACYELYEIDERREEWDHVYIRAHYVGRAKAESVETDST